MRTRRTYLFLLFLVLSCSMVLVSCEAITTQQIPSKDSGSRMNGFPGMNGGKNFNGGGRGNGGFPGMNGRTQRNGGQGTDGGSTGGSTDTK